MVTCCLPSENGLILYLWIGMNVNPEWVQNLFGVQSVAQIDIDKVRLSSFSNCFTPFHLLFSGSDL